MITKTGWGLIGLLTFYYVLRIVFSIVSYDSGLPSGIFLPILTMGALIGATYGLFMAQLGLLPQKLVVNLIIFSMAGYFAAIIRAPFYCNYFNYRNGRLITSFDAISSSSVYCITCRRAFRWQAYLWPF